MADSTTVVQFDGLGMNADLSQPLTKEDRYLLRLERITQSPADDLNDAKILNRADKRNHADLFKTLQKSSYKQRLNLNQLKEKVKVLERQQQYDKIDLKLKTDKAVNQKRLLENILNPKEKVLSKTRGYVAQAKLHNNSSISELRSMCCSEKVKKPRSLSLKKNNHSTLTSKDINPNPKIIRLHKNE